MRRTEADMINDVRQKTEDTPAFIFMWVAFEIEKTLLLAGICSTQQMEYFDN